MGCLPTSRVASRGASRSRNDRDATSVSKTAASAGGSGKVRVPGLGHERQERVRFLIGVERAAAQLADRGDRVGAWRGADQLIQRHQIAVATGLRYLSGIRARGN